jgi:hypothetical protein
MSEIEQAIEVVRDPAGQSATEYVYAARLLADVAERAREWFADVDLVYPSQTEQHIRNALREILEGPDE